MLRSQPRKRSQSYALSATSFLGLFLGRPLPRGTRTRSKVSWANPTSARLAREMEGARGIPFPSTTSIRFVPLPTLVNPTSSPPFLPGRSCRRGTPATTPTPLPHPGSRGTPARSLSIPPPPATSSASAMPSHTPRISAASPSTHNQCAVHIGHRPGDGRFGRAEARAVGSFPAVHPSAHALAFAYLKISRKHTGFETTSSLKCRSL